MPDLNTKGAKFTCSTQVFFTFVRKKAAVRKVVRVSACASVKFVLAAVTWKMDAPKKWWNWAEICSMFPRCLCHCRRGTDLKEETPFGDAVGERSAVLYK